MSEGQKDQKTIPTYSELVTLKSPTDVYFERTGEINLDYLPRSSEPDRIIVGIWPHRNLKTKDNKIDGIKVRYTRKTGDQEETTRVVLLEHGDINIISEKPKNKVEGSELEKILSDLKGLDVTADNVTWDNNIGSAKGNGLEVIEKRRLRYIGLIEKGLEALKVK